MTCIRFDPLHITGEETDLHAQGSLSLKGNTNWIWPPTAPSI